MYSESVSALEPQTTQQPAEAIRGTECIYWFFTSKSKQFSKGEERQGRRLACLVCNTACLLVQLYHLGKLSHFGVSCNFLIDVLNSCSASLSHIGAQFALLF